MKSGITAMVFAACACTSFAPTNRATGGALQENGGGTRADSLCVVAAGVLANVAVTIGHSGDTLVSGTQYRVAHPMVSPPYAGATDWFKKGEPILREGHLYFKYGPTRKLKVFELRSIGEYRGTPVFELNLPPAETIQGMLFVPVQPGCVFQLYSTGG